MDVMFAINQRGWVFYPVAPGRVYVVDVALVVGADVIGAAGRLAYWPVVTRVVDLAGMLATSPRPLDVELPSIEVRRSWIAAGGRGVDMGTALGWWSRWCEVDSAARDDADVTGVRGRSALVALD